MFIFICLLGKAIDKKRRNDSATKNMDLSMEENISENSEFAFDTVGDLLIQYAFVSMYVYIYRCMYTCKFTLIWLTQHSI